MREETKTVYICESCDGHYDCTEDATNCEMICKFKEVLSYLFDQSDIDKALKSCNNKKEQARMIREMICDIKKSF